MIAASTASKTAVSGAAVSGAADSQTIVSVEGRLVAAPLSEPILGPFGRLDLRPSLIVTVRLASGVTGLGEIWSNFPPWGCGERLDILEHALKPMLEGERLDAPARLYAAMHAGLRLLANQWGAPGPVHQAIAGVDIALWDAHARAAGRPLAAHLGAAADRLAAAGRLVAVPVYASGLDPRGIGGRIAMARSHGHRRFKTKLSQGPEGDAKTLRAAREAAGDAPLMVDANQCYTPALLASIAEDVRAARLAWFEEPFPVDDEAAYRGWRGDDPAPLALGENVYGLDGLRAAMAAYAPAVVQPDITKSGGITGGLLAGRAVVAEGRRLCFHMFGGAIGLYASAHLAAAIPGADWLEMDANPNPLFEGIAGPPPKVEEGALALPPGPGLGITLDPAWLEARTVERTA